MLDNKLWGYSVFSKQSETLIKIIDQKINNKESFSILSLNTLKLYLGDKDNKLKNIFSNFDCIIPDGQSIVFASKILNKINIGYISGVELMIKLIEEANKKKYSLFFLGSPVELLKKVSTKINIEFTEIKKHDYQHGFYNISEENKIVERIAEFGPDILFIAFGSPRKEEFIHKYYHKLNSSIMMGVGGSYEVFVGDKKLNKLTKILGLRWLVRTFQDPFRLSKRYAVCNSYFAYLLIKDIIKNKFMLFKNNIH